MSSINPINVNTQGISTGAGFTAKPKTEKEKADKPEVQVGSEKPQVSPEKVLDYLSASSVGVVSRKTIDPSKHVDAASQARIESFMASFEDKVAEGLKAFEKEFAGVNVSDGAKLAVVLKNIEQEV